MSSGAPRNLARTPLRVWRCASCARVAFPRPAMCGRCAGRDFEPVEAGHGRLEERTELSRPEGAPLPFGTVRTEAGPVVVARLLGGEAGDEVRVRMRMRTGAIEAAP